MLEKESRQAHGTVAAAWLVNNDNSGRGTFDGLVQLMLHTPGWALQRLRAQEPDVGVSAPCRPPEGPPGFAQGHPSGAGLLLENPGWLQGKLQDEPGGSSSSSKIASARERRDRSYP